MSDDSKAWIWDQDEKDRAAIRRRLAGYREPESNQAQARAEPFGNAVGEILDIAAKITQRMDRTACKGHRDNVGACFSLTERECSENTSSSCPKRVLEFEAKMCRLKGEDSITPAQVYQNAGIPTAIAELIANVGIQHRAPIQAADDWWSTDPRPRVLVLSGYSQIGKSVAAANLVAKWRGRFIHVPTDFSTHLRDDAYHRSLLLPSLLVFDDVGLERLDGFDEFKQRFDAAFCRRVDAGNFTVITTNSIGQFRARYGDRVAERINLFGLAKELAA